MEQFNLDTWLQDKSRKVVTKDGREVEIIHTNSPVPHHPIVGFIDKSIYTWTIDGKLIYGKEEPDKNDLFFADEKEELTEFEKELEKFRAHILATSGEKYDKNGECVIKNISKKLLDLARKEILKDLPKWKKDNNYLSSLTYQLDNRGDGNIFLCKKGYAIRLVELLNLPYES